jgi:MFS family permease
MATRSETRVIKVAGLVQGIVLVTFPAAGTIFTSGKYYGLSSSAYGDMFLPQVATAIVGALLGAALARRITTKRVYLLGLTASLASMGLLLVSALVQSNETAAYPVLLIATAFLGTGFGLTVPVLNTYTAAFYPQGVDRAVLVLNALLGLGTVLAPVFVAIFVGLGFWWGLPVFSAVLLVILLAISARLPLRASATAAASDRHRGGPGGVPRRFWLYAGFITLYGICETMNGNWSQLEMTKELGASVAQASVALAVFWGAVTIGRVAFAAIDRWLAPPAHVPAAAAAAYLRVRPHQRAVARCCRGRHSRIRTGRAGLLGAAAAHNQLRSGAAHHDVGRRLRRRHRVLPAWLRDRGVRGRAAAGCRDQPLGDLRRNRDRSGDAGSPVGPADRAPEGALITS